MFILGVQSFRNFYDWAKTNESWASEISWDLSLIQWDKVMHVYVSKLTIISSDNGLSPGRRQAIIWTNAGILSIGPIGIIVNEILFEIHIFSFRKFFLKMSSGRWWLFCLGVNVLRCVSGGCSISLEPQDSALWRKFTLINRLIG